MAEGEKGKNGVKIDKGLYPDINSSENIISTSGFYPSGSAVWEELGNDLESYKNFLINETTVDKRKIEKIDKTTNPNELAKEYLKNIKSYSNCQDYKRELCNFR